MPNFLNIWGKLLIVPFIFLCVFIYSSSVSSRGNGITDERGSVKNTLFQDSHIDLNSLRYRKNILDTVYTLKKKFIEVLLDEQKILLRRITGVVDTFLCSTGTEFLEKGQETKMGIFLIKNKLPFLISKQFNNTKCLHWLGFNFGTGFHALESKSYYRYLGKRPSSHGCIRLSQEDAEKLFNEVDLGIPVIAHNKNNARVIEFLRDSSILDTIYTKREVNFSLIDRMKELYSGRFLFRKYPRIILIDKYIGQEGIEAGEIEKIPSEQNYPPNYYLSHTAISAPDKTYLRSELSTYRELFAMDTIKTKTRSQKDKDHR